MMELGDFTERPLEADLDRFSSSGNMIPDADWQQYQAGYPTWVKTGAEWAVSATTAETAERRGRNRAVLTVTGVAASPTLLSDYISVGTSQVYSLAIEHRLVRTAGRFLLRVHEYSATLAAIQTQELLALDGGSLLVDEFDSSPAGWVAGTATVLTAETVIKQSGVQSIKAAVTALGAGASSVSYSAPGAIDIGAVDAAAVMRWSFRASSLTNLAYVAFRWGSDAANYFEWTDFPAAINTWYDSAELFGFPDATVGTPDLTAMNYRAMVVVAAGGGAYTGNVYFDIARVDPAGGDAEWPSISRARMAGALASSLDAEAHVSLHADTRYIKLEYGCDQLASGAWYLVSQNLVDGLTANLDANPAAGQDTSVYADSGGLVIQNGRLLFLDRFGSEALSGYGFGSTWARFIASGIYNGDFRAGSGSDIPVTEVGSGTPTANYLASLSRDLPSWVVAQSDTTLQVVADASASGGVALKSTPTAASQTSRIYQDIPIADLDPTLRYALLLNERYDFTGTSTINRKIYGSWRAADHSLIGSRTSATGTWTTDRSYMLTVISRMMLIQRPAGAVYFRLEIELAHGAYTAGTHFGLVWISDVQLVPWRGVTGYANNPHYSHLSDFSLSSIALATVAAGLGGACAGTIAVLAPMALTGYQFWSADTSLARSCEMAVYRDHGPWPGNMVRVPQSTTSHSFTPSAASKQEVALSPAVYLTPGLYWMVLRNTSTARVLTVGRTNVAANSWSGNGLWILTASVAALGDTLDTLTWTSGSNLLGLALQGFGDYE
jgi:hypothetical protein